MTPQDIENMEADREMDLLVAERVMGKDNRAMQFVPMRYSTDIAAAWQVVDKLRECGKNLSLEAYGGAWRFHFNFTNPIARRIIVAEADTAPLAICRAALMAVSQQEIKMVPRIDPQVARLLGQPNEYEQQEGK